jgi:hypothetical protein
VKRRRQTLARQVCSAAAAIGAAAVILAGCAFMGDGGLELVDPGGGTTTIVHGFPGPRGDPLQPETGFFYGHLPVQDLLAWWRG